MSDHLTPELWDFILRWLPQRPARVLDIGCGDGTLTRRLVGEGYDATGLDPEAPREEGYLRDTLEEFRSTATFDAAVAVPIAAPSSRPGPRRWTTCRPCFGQAGGWSPSSSPSSTSTTTPAAG